MHDMHIWLISQYFSLSERHMLLETDHDSIETNMLLKCFSRFSEIYEITYGARSIFQYAYVSYDL